MMLRNVHLIVVVFWVRLILKIYHSVLRAIFVNQSTVPEYFLLADPEAYVTCHDGGPTEGVHLSIQVHDIAVLYGGFRGHDPERRQPLGIILQ